MTDLKVLIPLDGSPYGERALAFLPLLKAMHTQLIRLIGVVDESEFVGLTNANECVEREEGLLGSYLSARQAELASSEVQVGHVVTRGNPSTEILRAAEHLGADLIVVATHGRSGVERWRLGSVSDKVIRSAKCNVLVVNARTMPLNQGPVLVPLDGSELAEHAIPVAVEIAQALKSQVHLVRVATFPAFLDDGGLAWLAIQESVRAYLRNLEQQHGEAFVYNMRGGDAADCLLSYASENHCALTVMTSHGHGGFMRSALGSVTDRVIGSRTPVVVVHASDD